VLQRASQLSIVPLGAEQHLAETSYAAMTKPPLASAPLTYPRLHPFSTRPAGIRASHTWAIERSLVISTTSYALFASTAIPGKATLREGVNFSEHYRKCSECAHEFSVTATYTVHP
jgi:hypothetical protein